MMKHKYFILILLFLVSESMAVNSDLNSDGTVNNNDLAILGNEWLQAGTPSRIFPGPSVFKCNQVQRFYVPAGNTVTVFDINDGPCLVTNFWIACNFADTARKSLINIYFDNHSSPDIQGWTGELFGCGFDEPANFRGDFVGVTNSQEAGEGTGWSGFSGYLRVPMPYYSSVKIEIQNSSVSNGYVWSMIERSVIDSNRLSEMGLSNGMYLKTYGYGENGNKVEYSEVTLLETTSPTILAGVFQFFNNSNGSEAGYNFRYLEGDHRIYYGGETSPSYTGSGTEDFFHSSWYFQEGLFDRMDECLVLKNDSNYTLAASRFFPLYRAPFHPDGIKFTWTVGEPAVPNPGNTYSRWIVWYYE
ncbi:MAG: DUF2961 domain-containing protein [Sedimentisphaerales bacterium]|nr:DUF2961 domain-containing protein [Sedimentisphaerales bacterium]